MNIVVGERWAGSFAVEFKAFFSEKKPNEERKSLFYGHGEHRNMQKYLLLRPPCIQSTSRFYLSLLNILFASYP